MPSLFEEQIRAEDTAYAMYTDHGSYSQSEAGSYFPEMPDYDSGVSGPSRHAAARGRGGRHPGDRQPERGDHRGMDRLCRKARAGGCRGARAQHVFHPDRRDDERSRRRGALRRSGARGKARGEDSGRGETVALFQLDRPHGAPARRRRRRWPGACSIASISRISTWRRCRSRSESEAQYELRSRARRCSGSACSQAGLSASLAATSGVETAEQVIKYLLVGADAVMTTSALLRHGPHYMQRLVAGLARSGWMRTAIPRCPPSAD